MRKSAIVCVSFIASLMLTHYIGKVAFFALCLAAVLGVAVLLILKKSSSFPALCACAMIIGNLIMGAIDTRFEYLRKRYDGVSCEGQVKALEVLDSSRAYVEVKSLEGVKQGAYFKLLCTFDKDTLIQKGDLIEAKFYIYKLEDSESFPTRLYNEGKGTVLKARAYNASLVSSSAIWSFHSNLTSYIESVFDEYLGEFSNLAKGLFLGSKSALDDEQKDELSSLGIIHVLSVSGLHFALLIGIFSAVLNAIGLHKITSCTVVALFSLFYMFLTGFSPSVCRAGIMTFFVLFDFVLRKSPDKLTTLSITGVLMCLAEPCAAINLSFQLSFLATFGLIAASNSISFPLSIELEGKPLGKSVQKLLQGVVFSLCAMFFCLAPISHSFKSISLLAPAGNLICTPFAELLLAFSFILIPLSILPHLAGLWGLICQGVGYAFTFLCDALNNEHFALMLDSAVFTAASAVLTGFCVLTFLLPLKNKKTTLLVFITGSAALILVCSL